MIIDVYADIVFLVNFGINAIVMALVNVLGRRGAKWWRIVLGGVLSALLYVLLLFSPFRGILNVFTSFVVLLPGLIACFGIKNLRHFLVNFGLAYISAFALGGLVMVTTNLVGVNTISTGDFATIRATPLNLAIAVAVAFGVVRFVRRYTADKAMDKKIFCQIGIEVEGKKAFLQALVDTGMTLTEPISQNPVIIAEMTAIADILPEQIHQLFINNQQDDLEAVEKSFEEAGWQAKFRLIPFKAIGQQNGVMLGFRPGSVTINNKPGGAAIIAICPFTLSNCGEYQGLINPVLYNVN
ncbi:MAG: sigma-E processing peptidase SpoIIGA [Defluviitaleaceae bacterium]|nr:sigma-E processing peptidase SpoIIGA [Defluviitaleaceae bacterium]